VPPKRCRTPLHDVSGNSAWCSARSSPDEQKSYCFAGCRVQGCVCFSQGTYRTGVLVTVWARLQLYMTWPDCGILLGHVRMLLSWWATRRAPRGLADAHLVAGGRLHKRRASDRQCPWVRQGATRCSCRVTTGCAVDVASQPRLGTCHSKPTSISREANYYVVLPLHLLASGRAAYSNASRPAWRPNSLFHPGRLPAFSSSHVSPGGDKDARRWSPSARAVEPWVGRRPADRRVTLAVLWFEGAPGAVSANGPKARRLAGGRRRVDV
jgi:hypothetical protein